MKQVVQNMKNGESMVVEVPIPQVKPGYILIRTATSLVSSGTERMLVDFAEKNLLGKARSRPDLFRQVIEKAQREGILTTLNAAFNRLDQPIVLGYSSSGTVLQVGDGVSKFSPGDRVACAGGGYAVHAEYAVIPENLASKIPDDVPFEDAAFATISSIALNGVRLANPQIGETAAVIGLGLLGLITAQILLAGGCQVIGMDIAPERVKKANDLGIIADLNDNAASNADQYTSGLGFDHVFICADTKSDEPVSLAGKIARDRATIVAVGAIGMNIPRKSYYEKELTFRVARSYGPGRYDPSYEEDGNDYPVGYIRWTEGRNLDAILSMLKKHQLKVDPLITHRFKIADAIKAYDLLSGKNDEDYLGIIITYPEIKESEISQSRIDLSPVHHAVGKAKLNIGVIGAGNYANAVFLPVISKNPDSDCFGIVSARGLHAQQSGKKFGFNFASSKNDDVLNNNDIDVAVILTQHDLHAELTAKALENGKHVYCEKPLAINREGLENIVPFLEAEHHPYLTVGFNRRYAPFIQEIKSIFNQHTEPMFAHYRINAGFLPKTHWLHDESSGGGRLIGEGCHFIDLIIHLIGSIPTQVQCISLPNNNIYSNDNFTVLMNFADGSIGQVSYLANGSKSLSKEYLEIFSNGKSIVMDDYRKLSIYGKNAKQKQSILSQDKGHSKMWEAFINAIINNGKEPIDYKELIQSSYVTLACDHARKTHEIININKFIAGN